MTNFGDDSIVDETVVRGSQFSLDKPNWFFAQVHSDELHDTTNPLAVIGGK